jgi:hypothetical protein
MILAVLIKLNKKYHYRALNKKTGHRQKTQKLYLFMAGLKELSPVLSEDTSDLSEFLKAAMCL